MQQLNYDTIPALLYILLSEVKCGGNSHFRNKKHSNYLTYILPFIVRNRSHYLLVSGINILLLGITIATVLTRNITKKYHMTLSETYRKYRQ